jgi:soluble lytic murein transglycosylase-like protein
MVRAGRRWELKAIATAALVAVASACGSHRAPPSLEPEPAPVPADASTPAAAVPQPPAPKPVAVRRRPPAARVDSAALERQVTARYAHRPLAAAIARRTRQPELADRAAIAVVREATRAQMSPSLLAAVLLVENRSLDTAAVSSQGAVGLMQVMPMHAGGYGCASADLRELDANVCHGAQLLRTFLARSRSVQGALRRYNGCVRGTNTPRCQRYAPHVLRLAGAIRRDVLASAQGEVVLAASPPGHALSR